MCVGADTCRLVQAVQLRTHRHLITIVNAQVIIHLVFTKTFP